MAYGIFLAVAQIFLSKPNNVRYKPKLNGAEADCVLFSMELERQRQSTAFQANLTALSLLYGLMAQTGQEHLRRMT